MELLVLVRLQEVGYFVRRLMSSEKACASGGGAGLKVADANDTFVSVKFSRSFV